MMLLMQGISAKRQRMGWYKHSLHNTPFPVVSWSCVLNKSPLHSFFSVTLCGISTWLAFADPDTMVSLYSCYGPTSSDDQIHRPLNVVITGGCGFLGRHIAKSLYNEFKHVRINIMDTVPADTVLMKFITDGVPLGLPIGFSIVDRDVTRLPHLMRIFKDTDIVFHCAARTDTKASITKMSLVNVDGTRNVIRACKECGVRALVYSGSLVQSLKANITTQHGICESSWDEKAHSKFIIPSVAGTKNEAEQLVLEAGDDTLFTCSIRCPPLYGEFDTRFVPSAMSLSKLCYGFLPNCGDPNMRMTAMYAGNAGWAHVCAAKKLLDPLTREAVSGQFFYVGDLTPSDSYSKFFMNFLRPLGYSQTVRIPLIVLEVTLFILSLIVVIFSCIINLNSSYYLVEYQRLCKLFSISHTVVWGRAQSSLGYKPKYTFHRAVQSSVKDWYSYLN